MADNEKLNKSQNPLAVEFECSTYFPNYSLAEVDSDTEFLIRREEERQARKLIFIASESIQPLPVREVLGSVFTNIYAEGYVSQRMDRTERHLLLDYDYQLAYHRRYWDKRYYKGADYADFVEALAENRICELFATPEVPADQIFANVQALSGAPANNAIYEAFLEPGDTVMGMDLTNGGHLTHGSESNRSGRHYNIVPYSVNMITGNLDYEQMRQLASKYKPKMIIAGYSAFPWNIDWPKMREVADAAGGAILMADIAHTAGLVVAGQFNNPIGYADVVVFTTHKTLCGPRGAVILTTDEEKARLIDAAVFPGEQGGPHLNNIAAKAVCFKLAMTDEFAELQKSTVENAQYFGECLTELGLKLAYGGTDSHLLLIDLKSLKSETGFPVTGEIATRILDLCGITCNKNTISGDTNAAHPTAIRFGMTWVTQRGITKPQLKKVAELVHKVLTNIRPFHYIHTVDEKNGNDEIGRGKIHIDTIREVQQEVQKLVLELNNNLPELETSYPHFYDFSDKNLEARKSPLHGEHETLGAKFDTRAGWVMPKEYTGTAEEIQLVQTKVGILDNSDFGIIELTGDIDRVRPFLHEIGTNNLINLEVGQVKRTLLLDTKGELLDDVLVYHLPSKGNGFCRFLLTTHAENTKNVLDWLRCLSDEYVIFDDDMDLYAKIQGPIIIHDLKDNVDNNKLLTSICVMGSKAEELLKSLTPDLPVLAGDTVVESKLNELEVIISRLEIEENVHYHIFTHPEKVTGLWQGLIEGGKALGISAIGVGARDELRSSAELPRYDSDANTPRLSGADLYETKLNDLFFFTKPYFIGLKKILEKITQQSDKVEYSYQVEDLPLRKSCLWDTHKKLGGKMVSFVGWEMPVMYANSSIQDEHIACRKTVAFFDVSHMGVFEFKGEYATRFLDILTTNYVSWLYPGQAQYSYLLDPDGNVIDDIFLYKIKRDHFMMIVNAANAEKDWAWINAVHSKKYLIDRDHPLMEVEGEIQIRNLKDPSSGADQLVDLALQGPFALKTLQDMTEDKNVKNQLARLQRGEFIDIELKDIPLRVARTGYTGAKVGFEMYLHPEAAPKFWDEVIAAGEQFGIKPTGLGARDSTRTEAGFPLHGDELAGAYNVTPIDAGYGAFVKFHKPFFIGRAAMLEKAQKREMDIVRFRMDEKGVKVVKTHDPVVNDRGEFIGNVTSSVSIEGYQWGLAYIKRKFHRIGGKLHIYPLPRKAVHDSHGAPEGMDKVNYGLGDKTVLPVTASIQPRFPQEGELEEAYNNG
ncbi:glycine cleavage system aminomethyltransferase GcvT [[Eubacterium] cellulosolvens]